MSDRPALLERLTWPEIQDILPKVELVLIPVGSCEQHGPNLELACDADLARAVCLRLENNLRPRLLVTPAIPFGISPHHMGFPGTVTLRESTLQALVHDVIASLMHHGLRRFLLVNGHGGNIGTLNAACTSIQRELNPDLVAVCTYYNMYDPEIDRRFDDSGQGGHACGMEVSLAMVLQPKLVRSEALAAMEPGPLHTLRDLVVPLVRRKALDIPLPFDQLTRNGCMGDARRASLPYGQAMVDSIVAQAEALIEGLPEAPWSRS
ncbi:MAG: creatininase family protein [Pseudomonadota bacterium]